MVIKNENFKRAIDQFLANSYVTPDYEKASAIQSIIEKLMVRRKVDSLYEQKGITDILAASALLYDVYIVDNHVPTYFLLRDNMKSIFEACEVAADAQEMFFQMCESFQGEDSPIVQLIPQKGYPDDLFADAVWIYENFWNAK